MKKKDNSKNADLRKWKTFRDLRIYLDQGFEQELDKTSVQDRKLFLRAAHVIGERYGCKLRELGLKTPVYDHIFVYFSNKMKSGSVDVIPHFDRWQKRIAIGVPASTLLKLLPHDRDRKLVELLSYAISELAKIDSFDEQVVDECKELLLEFGEKLEITHKVYETKLLRARVFFTVAETTDVFVSWTNKKTSESKTVLVAKLEESRTVPHLISKVTRDQNFLELHPRLSATSEMLIKMDCPEINLPIKLEIGSRLDLHHLVVPRQADKSCLLKNVENSVGVKSPSDPCGLTSL